MTATPFKVKNGLIIGSSSTQLNSVLDEDNMASDSNTALATQQSIKAYVDAETANVASDTLTFTNKTFDANGTGNSISNIDFADFASGVVADEDNMASDSATKLATQQSIKAYVDSEISGISTTAITQNNTNVTVSDSGSNGTITFTADGNSELVINDTSATFSGNVQVDGNLNVSGTTTTVNTTNVLISDPIQVLSATNSGGADVDSGIMIERGSAGNNAVFYWNEGADKFKAVTSTSGHDATAITDSATATIVANIEGNVTGDVTGNADTATEATNVTVTANNTANETVYLTFVDGATGTQGIETDTGLSYNPSTNVLSTTASAAQYSDLAERFAADTTYEPGTVVALGGAEEITATQEERSEKVFGVISRLGQAGYMMNAGAGTDATHPLIALAGRVQVKVLGTVSKGDRLVTSAVSGVARRAEADECTAFNVIGRALENKHTDGLGEVLCFVTAKS